MRAGAGYFCWERQHVWGRGIHTNAHRRIFRFGAERMEAARTQEEPVRHGESDLSRASWWWDGTGQDGAIAVRLCAEDFESGAVCAVVALADEHFVWDELVEQGVPNAGPDGFGEDVAEGGEPAGPVPWRRQRWREEAAQQDVDGGIAAPYTDDGGSVAAVGVLVRRGRLVVVVVVRAAAVTLRLSAAATRLE
jgi:hypothetical protein